MNTNRAMLEANVQTRAKTLFTDGYTYQTSLDYWTKKGQPELGRTTLYLVMRPDSKDFYIVDAEQNYKCNCPCYAQNGLCKHSLAIEEEVRTLAQFDEAEAYWMTDQYDGTNFGVNCW